MPIGASVAPPARHWLIAAIAALGFAFDQYEILVAPLIVRPVLKLGLWYWEEDSEFELDYHLRHVALPQPGRIRELLAMVSLDLSSALEG